MDSLIQRAKSLKKRSGNPSDPLDRWVERALKKEARSRDNATDRQTGTVVSTYALEVDVEVDDLVVRAQRGSHTAVPGDRVEIGWVGSDLRIVDIHPRRTKLSRPDVDNAHQERLIVANIDVVVIVVSVVSPPLHPRLIDRYMIAIQNGGANSVVCVNKIDLLEDDTELEVLQPYQAIGVPVVFASTKDVKGIEELRYLLRGKTVAFVGHSGVGKSSLGNAFAPELPLKTNTLMEGYGRGAHTTTVSSLHRLEDGTTIIDTPGIRSFGLWASSQSEVQNAFPEFQNLKCRFANCSHLAEPGCTVREAVETGAVSRDRYETFLRLCKELL